MSTAVVVGSGPNGLAAAVHLARHGVEVQVLESADTIGGGTRSSELTLPGLLHDECSAFHPMGAGSPYLQTLDLERYGLRWKWADVDCAHPLDSGQAGLLHRSVDATAAGLGADGRRWQRMFGGLADGFDDLATDLMRPIANVPRHPLKLASFGPRALLPATATARWWRTEKGRALFGGVAAHAYYRLDRPATSAVGLMIVAAGHRYGWPVAEGGSRSITTALAAMLTDWGGKITTGTRVRSVRDFPPADVVLLDVAPSAAVDILGDRLPSRVAKAYRRYRHGPAAFKVDFAIEGGVPWTNPDCALAGTVHLGGTFAEIADAERDVATGRMPTRPFVLVGQQYLADPGRSKGDLHPLYAYAHVPHGYSGDATEAVVAQIERFAPGFRDRVVATVSSGPVRLAASNPNYVGGDIIGGANTETQVVLRPRIALDPYSTGVPGTYLCSASTPPGAGAHGMSGYNAAQSALRYLRRHGDDVL
ncbi:MULTISPECIES: NAD(P)/FAD-dependent oxidoreductase [Rhodococcus]|uniref:phytoene desaturase family protein n=1 Tax=Rhodococcus TaxID=1827 RepID=UPI0029533B84|nr:MULTISPECIES: NAD(P)/FAD-dependent oxidoreductase [Rhodococcus]MDV7242613.1 NAD(P)/FAD-dependent oxidoreductase [Rhodococcus oxybenzonivorans]MDV7276045.1 NAD(P)/FAD-dependent oxidoreductase [Rhodococcus oxybenzonivorans]MDV7332101.1 NAD(P)/FAD-dependent oxidoreductase [Rhodococcus oxybenzonivorans]MDV8027169.1 NAD(P)/FAD-dependent oxidoreductase [Rhodococcus sp. IEGM 27]MDV8102758.1 NAD(P)/FAD-dependent oxidoreductase [Rhodococcus sp. IEGM 69]